MDLEHRNMSKKKILIIILGATVIIGLVMVFLVTRVNIPKITSFTPQDGSKDVALDTTINLVFERNLTNDEKNKVSVKINPQVDIDASWAGKQYNIAGKKGFNKQTTYTVNAYCDNNKLLTFSFTTIAYTPQQIQQEGSQQSQLDRQFSEDYTKTVNANPWIASLPIERPTYRIVYDFQTNSFRIRILVPVTDNIQKQSIIDAALKDIKNIGFTQTPIPYYVLTL